MPESAPGTPLHPSKRSSIVLEVQVGRFLDTSLIKADVRPRFVRLLVKGRLLQLALPDEVRGALGRAAGPPSLGRSPSRATHSLPPPPPPPPPRQVRPDASAAQRSKATGALVLTMPLERPRAVAAGAPGGAAGGAPLLRAAKSAAKGDGPQLPRARVVAVCSGCGGSEGDDDSGGDDVGELPDL
jgi:protein TilB